jgi:hypothetical protein
MPNSSKSNRPTRANAFFSATPLLSLQNLRLPLLAERRGTAVKLSPSGLLSVVIIGL